MLKKILKISLYLTILLSILIFYLSYFGIETKRFNNLIEKEILSKNKKIDIELKKIKFILNLKDFSFNLKTNQPKIIFNNKFIKIDKVTTNFSLKSFFDKNFSIDDLEIISNDTEIRDLIHLSKLFQNNTTIFILDKIVKKGLISLKINLHFDKDGKIQDNYKVNGLIKNTNLKLLKKQSIEDLNFEFDIKKEEYLIKNLKSKYKKIYLSSNSIIINEKNKFFFIKGDIKNINKNLDNEVLNFLSNNYFKKFKINQISLTTDNLFSFKINKEFKFNELNVSSKIKLDNLNYEFENNEIKKYIPDYKDLIQLSNHNLNLIYNNDKLKINGNGSIIIDKKSEKIDYSFFKEKDKIKFNTNITIENSPLNINFLNYHKKKQINSFLKIDAIIKKNEEITFNEIKYKENKNIVLVKELQLHKNFKIKDFKEIKINLINKNKLNNNIVIRKNNKKYEIFGDSYDLTMLIDEALNSNNNSGMTKFLNNFDGDFKIKIGKANLDKSSKVKNIEGNLNIKKSKINNLNLTSKFSENKILTLTIVTNKNNEKITTLFSDNSEPIVKKYKFIKGFEGGALDFYSIKKDNTSKSKLKIYDFKLHKMSTLTKLLTLADPRGFADLLTGEGVRFNDFEMDFRNKNKLMTIDEIYAIGPSISILMSGYVEDDKLISLRGTLVPATTLNKVLSSIPYIGNILVGKKKGEGIFGVSFKIKGPPKNLKTTVNPIKTLTPRFITRTIQKTKK